MAIEEQTKYSKNWPPVLSALQQNQWLLTSMEGVGKQLTEPKKATIRPFTTLSRKRKIKQRRSLKSWVYLAKRAPE